MAPVTSGSLEMDVVLYQEDGQWIAQGLQYDIMARGHSPTQAADRFDAKVGAELIMSEEIGDESPLAGVGAAPQRFWKMFKDARMTVEKDRNFIRIADQANTAKVHSRMKIGENIAA